jgi:RNA polymerase sigma-70 factor, ECF subfamily
VYTLFSVAMDAYERGRAAWPNVALEREPFEAHLKTVTGDELGEVHAEDLYLACACALGVPEALTAFEREIMSKAPSFIAPTTTDHDIVAEAVQRLREKLLVAKDGPPRIATYSGRGPLAGFVRVAAIRMVRDVLPAARARAPLAAVLPVDDPELDFIKAKYREQFSEAIATAIAALPSRDRNLLALTLIDGLSTDAVGKIYGKDGATVRRWIAKARETVLEATRTNLQAALSASTDEVDSLIALLKSRWDVSVARHLRE